MHIHIEPLTYFGGSFDPVHLGHVQTALTICKRLNIHHLFLLPCGQPVFKSVCQATSKQRLEMLKLATDNHPELKIDTREIFKTTPSYTIDTLQQLRAEISTDRPLIFILGQDAFLHFQKWKQWEKILELTHLIVINRAEDYPQALSKELSAYLKRHKTLNIQILKDSPCGSIYQLNAGEYHFASSSIRQAIVNNKPPYGLDESVKNYILLNKLYQTI